MGSRDESTHSGLGVGEIGDLGLKGSVWALGRGLGLRWENRFMVKVWAWGGMGVVSARVGV